MFNTEKKKDLQNNKIYFSQLFSSPNHNNSKFQYQNILINN